jgi:hypothetical protein
MQALISPRCFTLPPQTNSHRVAIEKDRLYVSMQPIPRDAPPLPAGKLLVSAVPWEGENAAGVGAGVSR